LDGWRPYEPASRCTVVFDAVPRIVGDPSDQRRRAWEPAG
jgi:para-nitrobenzyl esterase